MKDRKNILIYGYFTKDKGNLGDELFKEAFTTLFPNYNLTFTDHIENHHLNDVSAVFFGGGSFLFGKPNISNEALVILKNKKIFYIGVGTETDIHPIHIELMRLAKLIAPRSFNKNRNLLDINKNIVAIPDIVSSIKFNIKEEKKKYNSVLILPNITIVPTYKDEQWKHISWEHFKFEFAQFVDYLVDCKFNVDFFAMCKSNKLDDYNAAIEIINKMVNRNNYEISIAERNYNSLTNLISKYDLVITQRYHGIILSEICKVPYINIHHHEKLKNHSPKIGKYISMFECSKHSLIDNFNSIIHTDPYKNMVIDQYSFKELIQKVSDGMLDGE